MSHSPLPKPRSRRHFLNQCGLIGTASFAAVSLSACGFALRQAPQFAFSSIYLAANPDSLLGNELRRNLQSNRKLRLLSNVTESESADVILEIISDVREKIVVGQTASGQVREFQLRLKTRFKLTRPNGKELIPETELEQQRDISFNESVALAKEAEEVLLYRDMQSDSVQQILRQLAAVSSL